ncbi:MAG: AraC family transcriptional regulator [Chryseolinea sp.]
MASPNAKVPHYYKIYLYKRVVQAKLFIDVHYAESINLNSIADEAYFSKYHFIRLFKSIYGKTPHHYLTQVRINAAKQLLKKDIQVSEVCTSVGFDSATSFAVLFKKSVGLSPSAYQQQQRQRMTDIVARPLRYVPNCFVETYGWNKN